MISVDLKTFKVRLDKKSQVVSIVNTRIETREPGGAV